MSAPLALALVRAAHTVIYVVMAASAFALLYAGVTGAHGGWLWVAGGLMAVEAAAFGAGGLRCPLTAVAARYGMAPNGGSDTYFPERVTRHTLRFFGPLIALAIGLILARWLWLGWR